MRQVVGVDGCPGGWVGVTVTDGRFSGCEWYERVTDVFERHPEAVVIGVDIPVGLAERAPRRADVEARRLLGPRRSSVFPAPARPLLEAGSYAEARALAARLGMPCPSAQCWALRARIAEVDALARAEPRLVEVHPEVSFRAMAGGPLAHPKRSWNGACARRALLERAGLALPDDLGEGGRAPLVDVLDAAAAAWSADRVALGRAASLPDPPERDRLGTPMAIHV